MKIAPEGWPFVKICLLLDAAILVVWYAWGGWTAAIAIVFLVLTVWVLAFFRDPEREGPRGDLLVIAPADGCVVSIAHVDEPMYLHEQATRVSIFMNVLNVHVNRYPVSGEIEVVHYNPGEFTVASHDKASLVNEQSSVGIRSANGPVLVKQIAGSIARRIVTDGSPGDMVRQGERMGMIRFGSRVDVFMERRFAVRVAVGEKVRAGTTVLAELPA